MFLIAYDVRNIQGYIFNTNKLKEINGASSIVKGKLIEYLKLGAKNLNFSIETDWKNKNITIFDCELDFEIAYEGGGNVVLIAKEYENAVKLSKYVSLKFIKDIGTLNIAYAINEINFVPPTERVNDRIIGALERDIILLNEKLREVKQKMPHNIGSFPMPIVRFDQETNLPLSHKYKDYDKKDIFISRERKFKQDNEDKGNVSKENKELDSFVEKGKDSFIGVIHIDGNDMAIMINKYRSVQSMFNESSGDVKQDYISMINLSI